MRRSDLLSAALLIGLLSASPLQAGNPAFKRLVRDLRAQCHSAPMGTGFLGCLARWFSPSGVSGLHMAIFDDREASQRLQAADLEGLVQKSIGTEMAPMVRVRSRSRGEHTYIYARPEGRKAELLIVTADPREVAVISLKVDPETFQTWMDDPEHMGRRAQSRTSSGPAEAESGVK